MKVRAAALLLLASAGAQASELSQTLQRLRERITLGSPWPIEEQAAGAENWRESRILLEPSLPDPDVAAVRAALGIAVKPAKQGRLADTTPPAPADLAESDAVRLTSEIRALALQLGNSPQRIYAYVRDNTAYSLYYGAKQNSLSVLLSRRANNLDTTTLLIALLRAAGVSARYGQGQVLAEIEDVAAWIGARKTAAVEAMTTVPLLATVRGSQVEFFHVWAEAYLDSPGGKRWVPLDASFKMLEYQPGIEVPVQPFDMDEYLSTERRQIASDLYVDSVRAYVNRTHPGIGMADVMYRGRLRPTEGFVEPPYEIIQPMESRPNLDNLRHRMTVALVRNSDQRMLLEQEFSVPRISVQSLTIASSGAAPVRPQLRVDDDVIATSSESVAAGTALAVRVTIYYPGVAAPDRAATHPYTAGDVFAFGFNVGQASDGVLRYRVERLLASPGGLAADPSRTVRETIHIAALRFLQRVENETRRVYELHQMDYLPTRVDSAATYAYMPGQSSNDRPFQVTASRYLIDAQGSLIGRNISRNTGTIPSADFAVVVQAVSPTLSALEHEVWEEIVVAPAASTVKILQIAQDRKIPVLRINAANSSTELAKVPTAIPQATRDFIAQSVRDGLTVIIPSQIMTYVRWRGFVYTRRTATGSVSGWFVNQLNGGDTGGNVQEPGPQKPGSPGNPLPYHGETTGDPVDISNGNMFYQAEDLRIPAPGFPLQVVRTYNSQVNATGPFGVGWTHSYDVSLREQSGSLIYRDSTGRSQTLSAQGSEWTGYFGLRVARDGTAYKLRFREGLELRFDSNGKLSSVADPNGNRQTLIYDGQGNIATVTDPAGRKITFSYNAQNRVTAITDFAGRRHEYRYDAAGDLSEAQDASGAVTKYAYYGDHNMKSVTGPEGDTTTWIYYGDDKAAQIIGPGGGVMQLFYLPFRSETVVVDERGNSRTYQYDTAGRVTRMTDPLGNVATRKYTTDGLIAEQTDFNGNTTKLSWDALGSLTKIVDPLGNTAEATYDPAFSHITQTRDANGNTTRFEYDAKGNLSRAIDGTGEERRYTHDSQGNVASLTDPENNAWTFKYNEAGQVTEQTTPDVRTVRVEYDSAGRSASITDPLGARVRLERDARDLATRVLDPLGSEISFMYDRAGRTTRITDANRQAQQLAYDASGNLARITTSDSKTVEIANAPPNCRCSSLAGMMSSVQDTKGARSEYSYDPRGLLSESRNAAGDSIHYRHDPNGNLAEIAYDDGTSVKLTYDARNRLTGRVYPDNTRDTFTYDAAGNLLTASNAHVRYTYGYDASNRLISARDSRFPEPIRYGYDKSGRRQRMVDPQGAATSWTYRSTGELSSIRVPGGQLIQFTYDGAGRRQKATFPNQTEANYTYDAAGRTLSIVYTRGPAEHNRFSYTYDAESNRTSMTDSSGTHRYTYDSNYRLTAATHPDQPAEQYAYDATDNRTSSHRDASHTYDAADRLTQSSSGTYLYDRRGNLVVQTIRQASRSFKYNFSNQLEAVEPAAAGLRTRGAAAPITYKYDPFGRRIEKAADGRVTRYLYDFGEVLAEYDGGGRLVARYTHGARLDERLLMERDRNGNGSLEADESFFYQTDVLGSVRAFADRAGNIVERYRYDSFGNLADGPGALGNPYFFTGREWDSETALYYYRARHYDPAAGRFLQPDTIWNQARPETLNRYVYVANNPVNFTDPSGHDKRSVTDGGAYILESEGVRLLVIEGRGRERLDRYLEETEGVFPIYKRPGWRYDPEKEVYIGPIVTTQQALETHVSEPGRQTVLVHPMDAVKTVYDIDKDTVHQLQLVVKTAEYSPTYMELPAEYKTFTNTFKFAAKKW